MQHTYTQTLITNKLIEYQITNKQQTQRKMEDNTTNYGIRKNLFIRIYIYMYT